MRTIRPARGEDVPAMTTVYNHGIAEGEATFETRAREEAEVAAWLDGPPLLVADGDHGEILGFARAIPYSDRCAYAEVGEYAIYLAPEARGRGVGTALLEALADAATAAGYHKLIGRLLTTNAAAHALAARCGFRTVGVHRRHGRLDGRWRDVTVVERLLEPARIEVRPLAEDERGWADEVVAGAGWGDRIVRLGETVSLTPWPTLVATVEGERAGLLTYAARGADCEVMSLVSLREGHGVARALLDAARAAAREAGCRRLWLITTNDNTRALELYQRWGLEIAGFHRHAVTETRRTRKPEIPERGPSGIPIAHEIELELRLEP
jgi:phosphinothricin acetyltransferase